MPKRGSDADNRTFFDEVVSVSVSRLRATGVIRLEDQWALIPFGEQTKLTVRPHEVPERRLVVLFSLPEVRSQKQKAPARR